MSIKELTGVAGVLVNDNKVLLVKRKYNPKQGLWCIPCGKVEANEDLEEALIREVLEETHLSVEVRQKLHHSNKAYHPNVQYDGHWYLVDLVSGKLQADDDAEAAEFFRLDKLPMMAFDEDRYVIGQILKQENKLTRGASN